MKSSRFISETREREQWLTGEAGGSGELLSTAALLRGVAASIEVPEQAEAEARRAALDALHEHQAAARQPPLEAPWYLRFGRAMRFVFTLGRKR